MNDGGDGHFIFARSVINQLNFLQNPFTASELYTSIVQQVTKVSQYLGNEQKPMLSSIIRSSHDWPDFIFIPK